MIYKNKLRTFFTVLPYSTTIEIYSIMKCAYLKCHYNNEKNCQLDKQFLTFIFCETCEENQYHSDYCKLEDYRTGHSKVCSKSKLSQEKNMRRTNSTAGYFDKTNIMKQSCIEDYDII